MYSGLMGDNTDRYRRSIREMDMFVIVMVVPDIVVGIWVLVKPLVENRWRSISDHEARVCKAHTQPAM